jgi:hypothetical protein
MLITVVIRPKILQNNSKPAVEKNDWTGKFGGRRILAKGAEKKYVRENMFSPCNTEFLKPLSSQLFLKFNNKARKIFYLLKQQDATLKQCRFFPIWPNFFQTFADNPVWDCINFGLGPGNSELINRYSYHQGIAKLFPVLQEMANGFIFSSSTINISHREISIAQ